MTFDYAKFCLPNNFFIIKGETEKKLGDDESLTFVFVKTKGVNFICNGKTFEGAENELILFNLPFLINAKNASEAKCFSIYGSAANLFKNEKLDGVIVDKQRGTSAFSLAKQVFNNANSAPCVLSHMAYSLVCSICEVFEAEKTPLKLFVQTAISQMQTNYATIEGIDQLAEELGFSSHHFIRTFATTVGKTPGKFLLDIRINAAKEALNFPQIPVTSVAGMCGFSSVNYFCQIFKKSTGETPGAWRKKLTNLSPAGFEQGRKKDDKTQLYSGSAYL